jgi:hypothetical protein
MATFDTNFCFQPGKMTILLDGGAGSSGKGKLASFIGQNADNWQFCCNAFMSNAAHWVVVDGRKYMYQSLNSVAHLKKRYEKMYICGGAVMELGPLLDEIKQHRLAPFKLGIHPTVAIVQDIDIGYERGTCNFEGEAYEQAQHSDCMKLGSTLHGVGAARARRILRRSDVLLARDIPELQPYICWTDREMMDRLEHGQAGFMEIAQGYQLGYLSQFYPKTTSRNCTVAAGLDDCGLPPAVVGDVIINFRTYPIRVNSNKYVHTESGAILTAEDMDQMKIDGEADKIKVLEGDSGGCYDDQHEITWEEVTESSGVKLIDPSRNISERSSLTKLERRVYTFSKKNLQDACRFNRTSGNTWVCVNFINYIDASIEGARGDYVLASDKIREWVNENVQFENETTEMLKFLGTGAETDDMIVL